MRAKHPRILRLFPWVAASILLAVIFTPAPYQAGGPGLVSSVGFASPAFAANKSAADLTKEGLKGTAKQAGLGDKAPELPVIIGNIIYAALSLTGVILVLLLIYGGFIWMQARGSTEDVKKAKDIITNAIIGIAIIALAFAVTSFVINRIVEAQQELTPASGRATGSDW